MSLPLVRGIGQALYPFTKRITFDTGITFNGDATERRWKRRAPLWEFEWTYRTLLKSDASALVAAFNALSGMYGSMSYTLGAVTFSNLAFLADDVTVTQSGPITYDTRLRARQTQNLGWTAPAWPSGAWPTFSTNTSLTLPYSSGYRWMTTTGDSPTGTRYSFPWWGSGISGLPTGPLRRFPVELVMPDVDAATFETFCCWSQGRLNTWNFADPFQGSAYYKIRFDTDIFEFNYVDVNHVRISVPLIEIN